MELNQTLNEDIDTLEMDVYRSLRPLRDRLTVLQSRIEELPPIFRYDALARLTTISDRLRAGGG